MSKKKHKDKKKKKCGKAIPFAEWMRANTVLESHAEPIMTVEFTYEGKIYKGTVPCVGEVQRA